MSAWELVIGFDWPGQETDLEALIREVVDPLHRENIAVHGVRIELAASDV